MGKPKAQKMSTGEWYTPHQKYELFCVTSALIMRKAQQIMKSVVHTINLKKLCHTNVSNLSIEHWISAIVETFQCVIFPSVIASAFGFYIEIYHQNIKLVLFPLEAH